MSPILTLRLQPSSVCLPIASCLHSGHKYVALKVYVRKYRQAEQEPRIFAHLQNVKSDHRGQRRVRVACDTFLAQRKDIPGQQHQCLVFEPLGMSLKELCDSSEGGRVKPAVLKPMIRALLEALDFLHTEAGVVHTGGASVSTKMIRSTDTRHQIFRAATFSSE